MTTVARRNTGSEKDDPWLTLPEAARMLGIGRHTLLARALDGELDTTVVAGRRFVSRASVEAALRRD